VLDGGCTQGHCDGGWDLELASRICDTLSVIA
jgi:hypothetical protein